MSESYLQLVSATTGPAATFVVSVVIILTVLAIVTFVSAIVLFVCEGICETMTGCFTACALLCALVTILGVLINPRAAVTSYVGEEPTGTVATIKTRETALGVEVESFKITLDTYPDDPTVIVDDCEFDKIPETGDHITFDYKPGRTPFDGEQVHIVLTNWWDAK